MTICIVVTSSGEGKLAWSGVNIHLLYTDRSIANANLSSRPDMSEHQILRYRLGPTKTQYIAHSQRHLATRGAVSPPQITVVVQ